jgi:hypothetical protein
MQSVIVIGPDGSDSPNGADELYCDRLVIVSRLIVAIACRWRACCAPAK